MKVNVTMQQLKKIRALSAEDFSVLEEMVRKHGITQIKDADLPRFAGLKNARLIRMRAGKVWLPMEVNGIKSTPFLGHKEPKSTSSGEIAKEFHRVFRIIHESYYGDFDKKDWVVCSRMAKEFDIDELSVMLRNYMQSTAFGKITLMDFYKNRNKLFRALGDNYEESKDKRDEDYEEDGGW